MRYPRSYYNRCKRVKRNQKEIVINSVSLPSNTVAPQWTPRNWFQDWQSRVPKSENVQVPSWPSVSTGSTAEDGEGWLCIYWKKYPYEKTQDFQIYVAQGPDILPQNGTHHTRGFIDTACSQSHHWSIQSIKMYYVYLHRALSWVWRYKVSKIKIQVSWNWV